MEDSLKSLENAARLAGEKGLVRFSRFLDPAEAANASALARRFGAAFASFGGYPQAERTIGCFFPKGEAIDDGEYPLVCLHSRYSSKFCSVSHRDLLGAFMSLGLTRSCIGDIIIVDADIYLFAHVQAAEFIAQSMTSAGKTSLAFRALDVIPPMPEPAGVRFSSVVSSLRLDGVLAAAYKLSRSESKGLVEHEKVLVGGIPMLSASYTPKEGDIISVRGYGKFIYCGIKLETKKGRLRCIAKIYK